MPVRVDGDGAADAPVLVGEGKDVAADGGKAVPDKSNAGPKGGSVGSAADVPDSKMAKDEGEGGQAKSDAEATKPVVEHEQELREKLLERIGGARSEESEDMGKQASTSSLWNSQEPQEEPVEIELQGERKEESAVHAARRRDREGREALAAERAERERERAERERERERQRAAEEAEEKARRESRDKAYAERKLKVEERLMEKEVERELQRAIEAQVRVRVAEAEESLLGEQAAARQLMLEKLPAFLEDAREEARKAAAAAEEELKAEERARDEAAQAEQRRAAAALAEVDRLREHENAQRLEELQAQAAERQREEERKKAETAAKVAAQKKLLGGGKGEKSRKRMSFGFKSSK